MGRARFIAAFLVVVVGWTSPALAETGKDAPEPESSEASRPSRAATAIGLVFGGVKQLEQHRDFRAMPLGIRAGHQLDMGLYFGAAGEWSLNLPDEHTTKAFYYEVAGEVGYDYSHLRSFGAIPFARAGYVSTFLSSDCRHQKALPVTCVVTREAGAIGQVGFRYLYRFRYWENGIEFHYQFGTLENIGLRFYNAVRF